jgi:hypothetical protein
MSAAAALPAGRGVAAGRGVEPPVYLTSGCKKYPVHPSYPSVQLHTVPSTYYNYSRTKTIGQCLEDDKFFLGDLLLEDNDENVHFFQPFFLYEVHYCAAE